MGIAFYDAAQEQFDELLAAGDLGELRSEAHIERGFCLLQRGLFISAEYEVRTGLKSLTPSDPAILRARGLQYLGLVLSRQSDPASMKEAVGHLQAAAEISGDQPAVRAQILDSLGRVFSRIGDYETAVKWFGASLRIKEELGDRAGIAITCGGLGEAHLRAGRFQEAYSHYARDLAMVEEDSPSSIAVIGQLHCALAECCRHDGDYERAESHLARSDELARARAEDGGEIALGYVEMHMGRLAEARGETKQSLTFFQSAKERFVESEYDTVVPSVMLGIGVAHLKLMDSAAAREALRWAEKHLTDTYQQRALYEALAELARIEHDQEKLNLYIARLNHLAGPDEQSRDNRPSQAQKGHSLHVIKGPARAVSLHDGFDVLLQVRDGDERPCAGMEICLESQTLSANGSAILSSSRVLTDENGVATARVETGAAESETVLEAWLTEAPVKIEMHYICHVDPLALRRDVS